MIPSFIARGEGANRFEKIPLEIYANPNEAVRTVAQEIAKLIRSKEAEGKKCVLGLATGSSPIRLYAELVRMHKEENLSFKNVITFNLDEYLPMEKESKHSYWHFMHYHLFDKVDIDPKNVHIPDGTLPNDKISEFCKNYEQAIKDAGGIDLQVLGIGRTGHIGFNEPGSTIHSKTRVVYLSDLTLKDASGEFGGIENVPFKAITMGVETVMNARRVVLLAWGEKKAPIIQRAVEQAITDSVPATFLQRHPNCSFVVDELAASELVRSKCPWLCGKVEWTPRMVRKAVVRLCEQVNKTILKLVNKDYIDHGLIDLVKTFGNANKVNIQVFNDLQHTITGWPGGKPNVDDSTRPVKNKPYPKTVLIFSPHPDDDVISMGGTFARLVEQGHNVHVAYETSGNIAVLDDYAYEEVDTAERFYELANGKDQAVIDKYHYIKKCIEEHKANPNLPEDKEVLEFKTQIRVSEATAANRFLGVPVENVHFLRLPFYETGGVTKKPLAQIDVDKVAALLREVKPDQIFAAGDLADPHGTHYTALDAVVRAFNIVYKDEWFPNCTVWLYRGAWMEWEIERTDMTVPISPDELTIKRKSIFRHGSQCNFPAFPGDDPREFWERAEDRNRETANKYNKIGMAEYEAMESFARYDFKPGDALYK
ncbi:hypothetical protein M9Y10_036333 [Tritrichomonas musculus]|uniref:Glucosamine/galactosamine-6-phosphate isomerase domain-containing protein n=1 Tax=Tritrichomonas musculus TaxID=1915356 RepID=A0ABR2GV29_9EUKA